MKRRVLLAPGADLDGFRRAVRALVAEDVPPTEVFWREGDMPDLFGVGALGDAPPVTLSAALGELVERAVCHRDPERYALLYALIWRVRHGERALLEVRSDPLVHRLQLMRKAVARDLHKMHAFVRFRRVGEADGAERFVAWFEPEHHILVAAAPFFVERFGSMEWSILTPDGSLHWDRTRLVVGPPGRRTDVPDADDLEGGWRAYYESTYNPARTNLRAMQKEMPKRYWRNMPETAAIPGLVAGAEARVADMIARTAEPSTKRAPEKALAARLAREPGSLAELNRIIAASEPLVPGATRAVLGEGPIGAPIAFVGEQPGDQEDRQGRPFVGPAGQVLDRALAIAGIPRERAYLTNAVKHFKFTPRGKRRLHQSPTTSEVKHYRWWLMKELELARPGLVVALGATAVLALTGRAMPIAANRGPTRFGDVPGYITVHPSFVLRQADDMARDAAFDAFARDIETAGALAEVDLHPPRRAAGF
jgi:DNA polymerase